MSRYVVSPLAHIDLAEIYDYIAEFNVAAAKRMNRLLRNRFATLARNSNSGELRTDFADLIPEIRTVTVRPYVVYFRGITDGIEIVRVLHGARDPRLTLGR